MAKWVVTGGAGFIGSHVVEELVNRNEEVIVIDNLLTGKKENIKDFADKITFVKGSITDEELLSKTLKGVDYIIHLAALPSVPRSIEDPLGSNEHNITGTLNVFNEAKKAGVKRVVYASSSSVYGDSETLPKIETMPKKPLSFYALQKSTDEEYAKLYNKLYGSDFVGLRFFNVFGPRQDPHSVYAAVIPLFVKLMKEGKEPTIYGDGETSRDFTPVKNVVHGLLLTATSQNKKLGGEVFNLACGERISLNQLVEEINNLLGTEIKPKYEDFRVGDIKHSLSDSSKLKDAVGYEVVMDFKNGLKELV